MANSRFAWIVPTLATLAAGCSSSHSAQSDGGRGDGGGKDAPAADAGSGSAHGVAPTFTFESGPVRPLAMSADGTQLYAANTSNGSLDVFSIGSGSLTQTSSTFVGIDPVAVAVSPAGEVWVVNQISDSVSVVDLTTTPPHVDRTLLVGDEPYDIVFAGSGSARAFITTAHRGQQRTDPSIASVPGAGDPELTTPGIGRADVWVFDSTNLGTTDGGVPLAIVTLFGDTPRGLAVTPDGSTVYAAIFKSGNQSMSTSAGLPCPGFDSPGSSSPCTVEGIAVPGAPPGPGSNYDGIAAPAVSMMLHMDGSGVWRDVLGRDWTSATAFTLPDQDVFAIDANALTSNTSFQHVGTTLFNMAVNPVSGHVYVSNTQARNDLRFEGPGTFAGTTLQGHLAEAQITVIAGTTITPLHLNKHIDYSILPAPAGTAAHSLSMPLNMVVSSDGTTLYVSAFGSSKVGVFLTSELEANTFDPVTESSNYLTVSGGGPSGLVLDEARGQLYVATRFDDGVSVVNLQAGTESAHITLTNPEPAAVTAGRQFLYNSTVTSSNGEAACASCHPFGDNDHLTWDLGNPDADPTDNPINIKLAIAAPNTINGTGQAAMLHPMKGPMYTQTIRGTVNHGPMHWRGDRVSGYFGTDTSTAPPYNSELAFKNFILAFNTLVGLGPMFSPTDMQTYADFALAIAMPPNAVRALDNSLTTSQAAGKAYFLGCEGIDSTAGGTVTCNGSGQVTSGGMGHFADGVGIENFGFPCQGCHVLDPAQGFFGTDGESSFEALPQIIKIPQLRDLYEKVGMFGEPAIPGENAGSNGFTGPQVRGTGFTHDGSTDTLFRFLQGKVFNAANNNAIGFANGDTDRADVEQWLLAFDGDLAPIVGQQVTLRSDNATAAGPRIDLLIARAGTPFVSKLAGASANECQLVARMLVAGAAVSYTLVGAMFEPNNGGQALTDAALRVLAAMPGQEITYTCMPPGWVH